MQKLFASILALVFVLGCADMNGGDDPKRGRRIYPGAPLESPGVRLPEASEYMVGQSPAGVAAALIPPQPTPLLGHASDYETFDTQVIGSQIFQTEISVYKTHQRWSDCDVYLTLPNDWFLVLPQAPNAFVLSVFVYAIAGSSKTLVKSGRFYSVTNTNVLHFWLAAARGGGAERFEITTRIDPTPGSFIAGTIAALTEPITITTVATNDLPEPPEFVGVVEIASVVSEMLWGSVNTGPPWLEVVSVAGVNTVAAARYLMLGIDFGIGVVPFRVWPLGATVGDGFADNGLHFRVPPPGVGLTVFPTLLVSSSPTVPTLTGDGVVSMSVR